MLLSSRDRSCAFVQKPGQILSQQEPQQSAPVLAESLACQATDRPTTQCPCCPAIRPNWYRDVRFQVIFYPIIATNDKKVRELKKSTFEVETHRRKLPRGRPTPSGRTRTHVICFCGCIIHMPPSAQSSSRH